MSEGQEVHLHGPRAPQHSPGSARAPQRQERGEDRAPQRQLEGVVEGVVLYLVGGDALQLVSVASPGRPLLLALPKQTLGESLKTAPALMAAPALLAALALLPTALPSAATHGALAAAHGVTHGRALEVDTVENLKIKRLELSVDCCWRVGRGKRANKQFTANNFNF